MIGKIITIIGIIFAMYAARYSVISLSIYTTRRGLGASQDVFVLEKRGFPLLAARAMHIENHVFPMPVGAYISVMLFLLIIGSIMYSCNGGKAALGSKVSNIEAYSFLESSFSGDIFHLFKAKSRNS